MKKIKICGHRGFFEKYPQNTLPSFEAAIKLGCDRIEYDLHLTADGRLAVCHNPTVDSIPLGWPWEAQSSPRVARESWGWRSSHCRA